MTRLAEGMVVDGRYRIEALIGSGGMADVWLAEDLELPRRVALKVLHERYAANEEFVVRFRREAEAAARLQHVNIVSIFDRGEVGDTFYIAMAWLEGRTLRELINIGLTPPESVSIVRQILEAAGFAHHRGVIHRDLKPLNAMVDPTGLVTVTDFGIARAGQSAITDEGSVMGTVEYLSPEQAQGMEVTPLSDLYSIGIILYECLTGRVPFEGDTAVSIALKQMREEPLPPSAWNPAVSPALDAVVMRALRREPYERYPDANSFIQALDEADRAPQPVIQPESSNRWKWIVGVAGVLLGLVIAFGVLRDNTVEVPDVVNSNVDAAVTTLAQDGFKVGEIERVQDRAPNNRVINQDPRGESDRDCKIFGYFCSDPRVNLTVSGGPGRTAIPDVVGLPRDQAEQTLTQAGFGVTADIRASDSVEQDSVIETDPPAGEKVRRGSSVTMIVSSGARKVKVPAVVGETLNAARQQLSAVNLDFSSSEEPSDRPAGEVLTQSPDAGSRVAAGTTVTLTVSSGPDQETVDVPNLVGSTLAEAQDAIRAAGLVGSVREERTGVLPQDGRVINQSPDGGNQATRGDTVTITVAIYDPDLDDNGGITP